RSCVRPVPTSSSRRICCASRCTGRKRSGNCWPRSASRHNQGKSKKVKGKSNTSSTFAFFLFPFALKDYGMTAAEAIRFWFGRVNYEQKSPHFGDFKLDRMRRLLELLGNPQRRLRIVHIAGSKGKGSTSAMLASILQHAGYRVGLFTSPHLVSV